MLSLIEGSGEESAKACGVLSELVATAPIIVFADRNDADLARAVIRNGAKGYIPWTMGFEIVVQVIRFVLAGGTYVSPDCFLDGGSHAVSSSQGSPTTSATSRQELGLIQAIPQVKSSKFTAYGVNTAEGGVAAGGGSPRSPSSRESPTASTMTSRELAVIRAIQQGKSNKLIAYQLSMCESTVKAHLRNIMRKIGAKNRTDVAIKAQRILNPISSSADAVQAA
ncbi:MAG: response regulator transcription factor [Hyphomicrobiales bacterium]|nr:response regulator transcription factor [Hyphomicrobiales bacterium]